MNSVTISPILAFAMIAAVAILATRFGRWKRSYYAGIALWSRWLPVAATGIFIALLTVSLTTTAGSTDPAGVELDLGSFFSTSELVVLFLVGPLFLTRLGNILATATVVYCLERLLSSPGVAPTASLYLVSSSATVVAVLGDKMPWLISKSPSVFAQKLRQILLISVAIAGLAVVVASLVQVHVFSKWFGQTVGIAVPSAIVLLGLILLFVGWLSVALGFARNLTIPLLTLPSVFVLAFISAWPSYLLVVPFATCLALSLTTAERRIRNARSATGFSTTLTWGR